MANPILATLFRKSGPAGWVSTYFLNSADLIAGLGDAQAINTAEMAMLGQGTECPRINVSQLGVFRDANPSFPVTRLGGSTDLPLGSADSNIALVVPFFASATARSRKFLRGLPLGAVASGPEQLGLTVSANFKTMYDAWKTAMIGKVVLVPGKRTGPGPFQSVPLVSIPPIALNDVLDLSIRRAGRPFGRPPGRRRVGA